LHRFDKIEQFEEYGRLKGYKPYWAKIQAENYGLTEKQTA